jgi:surface antigen
MGLGADAALMFRRRLGLCVLLALLGSVSFGTASSLADVAPEQWQPTPAGVTRNVRPCPARSSTAAAPVCWWMTEDASAWMAQPAGSPYGWGQCTYYVGIMRADIWNDRAPPSIDPVNDWDAWTWAGHARAEGLAVDGDPRAGDVMVWSRQAVGNDTGHVAIVDAVGAPVSATGDLQVTISEMNLDGLDNASAGQGDTMVVDVPGSQLVPGMIQFIHRPGPGYAAPLWPSGSADAGPDGAGAPFAPGVWATESDPSLAVGLWSNHVATVSQSPAPVTATATTASGAVVKTLNLTANRVAGLGLPTGTYRVCVAQPASGGWNAATACAAAAWRAPVNATLSLGRPHRAGRRLSVPVMLGPAVALAVAGQGTPLVAQVRIALQPTARHGHAAVASTRTVYARALRLRAGRQVLSLPLTPSALHHAVLHVTVAVRATTAVRASAAQTSLHVR